MSEHMDRRTFLAFAASGVALGAFVVLHGCSSSPDTSTEPTPTAGPAPEPTPEPTPQPTPEPTPEPPPAPTFTDKDGSISFNHVPPHTITLTAAQQEAGAAVTLTTEGAQLHTHTVSLTAAEVAAIAAGATVSRVSSTSSLHSHTVTFN